jgi:L-rhamnose-H+ transport protein
MQQILGIVFHWIGGFSSASFYVPINKVKQWTWAVYWISLGFVAWIIMPTVGGLLTAPDLFEIIRSSDARAMFGAYILGVFWGFGGLMSGLGIRYMGLALGQSVSLGVCAVVGTLVPAFLANQIMDLLTTLPGHIVIAGLLVCILGIAFTGYAGFLKDKLLSDEEKKKSIAEFSMAKGFLMAIGGGIMSAFMAFSFMAGKPIAEMAVTHGTQTVFMNNPVLIFSLGGGFTTNFVYAMIMCFKHKSFGDFVLKERKVLTVNYLMAILSGIMWYGQFFFYGMGTTKMGHFDFSSWSIHMSSIIIFSNLWGLKLKEWAAVNQKVRNYLWGGIILLILSVVMIGLGNYYAGIQNF